MTDKNLGDSQNEELENEGPANEHSEDVGPQDVEAESFIAEGIAESLADATVDATEQAVVAAGEGGRVDPVNLESEMQRSYLDYAMSVIVGRALPDVRDGMKPVHRRILYTMYDGGYRPNAGYYKSMRVVGDVMSHYHPHGDASVYDALARMVQPWSLRYPLVDGQGNFGSAGNLGPAAPRYTECKMAPLAMEMVKEIDEGTVDFQDNYDGRNQEPVVLPARFPNLLVNGSEGIAVGMATRIPPHNLREVAEGVQWYLDNPEATREELLEALLGIIQGPDFPSGATILGRQGIEEAYRTGRGSIIQRAVVDIEESNGRTSLVVKALPYQVNPDNLSAKIAQLVRDGEIKGISDIRDETSGHVGQRLVIVLRRDAIPKVVLNNLYKRTQLQDSFPANMLALVDGVPRTLSIDGFIHHWVMHQLDVIVRRTQFRLAKARERLHILEGYLRALENLDEVIALIRRSKTVAHARAELMEFLAIDEVQADAILALQLRRLAAMETQKILEEHKEITARVADLQDILGSPARQREIISEEMHMVVDRFGDDRVSPIAPYGPEISMEQLVPEEDVVVTITRDGFAKRTKLDSYRAQRRGGKGIRGASLRADDEISQFFVTNTHDWLLFFTNMGHVYRAKAYELPEGGRDARGQHVANLLAFRPDEKIAQVLALTNYEDAEYLALGTKGGMVKKTRLEDYDSPRRAGLIAINLRKDEDGEVDEVISALTIGASDELVFVTRKGQSLRFVADDEALRPTGRATSGVVGIRLRGDDEVLAMELVDPEEDLVVVTEAGYAKRSPLEEYRPQNRGGLGIRAANLHEDRGELVGALVTQEDEELLAIAESGNVIRVSVGDIPKTGRNTMGVILSRVDEEDRVIAVTRNEESRVESDENGEPEVNGEPETNGEEPGADGNGEEIADV